ncbi:hypothetical protein V3481_006874 [Fusarium oxysporum f. sp. vasinfectum]
MFTIGHGASSALKPISRDGLILRTSRICRNLHIPQRLLQPRRPFHIRAVPFSDWDFYLLASMPNTGAMTEASCCAFPTGSPRDQSLTYSKPRTAYEPSPSEIDAKQGLEATDKTWQCPPPHMKRYWTAT